MSPRRSGGTWSRWSRPRAAPPTCGWAPRPERGCSCCAPPAPRRRWPGGTTSSPTTSRPWPHQCSRTGCCSPPTPRWAAAAPSRSSRSCWRPSLSPAGAETRAQRRERRGTRGAGVSGTAGRALSSLTTRGRCLVGGGLGLLSLGILLGERALVQLAVFVLALPLLSAATVARERFRLSARRTVTPARLPRGETAEVRLQLTNADTRTGGLWVVTEQLSGELGHAPRFVVERLAAGATTTLGYRVHGGHRGRHSLGPLRLRLVDPFGLVERSAAGTDTAPLVVVPRVRPLGPGGPAGGHGGGGSGSRRSIAVHGEDDVSTREYRHGDDLRKVHWRATARTGELMVRLEERPWRAHATLLLDTRSRAHLIAQRDAVAHGAALAGAPGDGSPPRAHRRRRRRPPPPPPRRPPPPPPPRPGGCGCSTPRPASGRRSAGAAR